MACVADGEAAEAGKLGEGALCHTAMATELLAGLDPALGNTRHDPAGPAFPTATLVIVTLVGMKLGRATTRSAVPVTRTGNGVQGRCQHHAIVPVGPRQRQAERRALPVGHKMALLARFAATRRVRAGLRFSLLAATLALSREHWLQSRRSASASCSRSTRGSRIPNPGRLPVGQAPLAGSCLSSRPRGAASPRRCPIAERA